MKNNLKTIITLSAALAMMLSTVPFTGSATPQEPDQSQDQSYDPVYAPDQADAPDQMAAPEAAGGPAISFNVFYQSLSPYGRWISYGNYGQVWIPSLGNGFEPYSTNGHWVYTDYGWTWVSDYSWGWAPFHYGRWLFDDSYGWIWVPGGEWAPAWVAWRNSSSYYGWAPLGPGMSIGISIGIPAARWCFVPRRYFGGVHAYRYYVPRARNVTIIHNTTIIRNVNVYQNNRYFTGPSRNDVQHATRRTIAPVRIASAPRAGTARVSNRELSIYRPSVQRGNAAGVANPRSGGSTARPAPERRVSPNQPSRGQATYPSRGATTPSRNMPPRQNPAQSSPARPEPRRQAPARSAPSRPEPQRTAPQRQPSNSGARRSAEPRQSANRMPSSRSVERSSSARSMPSREVHYQQHSSSRGSIAQGRGRGR